MFRFERLSGWGLARKLGISRARVTQILNLLKLPEDLIQEVEEMGDHWERRLVTERMLRRSSIDTSNQWRII